MARIKNFGLMAVCLFLPSLAFAQGCETFDPTPYKAPYKMDACPLDIQAWLDQANACSYFSGEYDPSDDADPERRKEIEDKMIELQCEYMGCAFHDLFAKYEGDIVYTNVLMDYEKILYGDNGVLVCNAEEESPPEERVGDTYLENSDEHHHSH